MHPEHGIEMSQMAERKAESSDLRALRRKMTEDQRRDIQDLQKMRTEGVRSSPTCPE